MHENKFAKSQCIVNSLFEVWYANQKYKKYKK